jgi:Putative peptidoglycan binding domain
MRTRRDLPNESAAVFGGGLDVLGLQYIAAPSLDDVRAGKATLRQGMQGKSVWAFLGELSSKRLLTVMLNDDKYDSSAMNAVKLLQARSGMKQTGIVDAATITALENYQPKATAALSAPAPSPLIPAADASESSPSSTIRWDYQEESKSPLATITWDYSKRKPEKSSSYTGDVDPSFDLQVASPKKSAKRAGRALPVKAAAAGIAGRGCGAAGMNSEAFAAIVAAVLFLIILTFILDYYDLHHQNGAAPSDGC